MTEDEIFGWHHPLNGYEFEQALSFGDGEGSLACCRPWGCAESDMIERLSTYTFFSRSGNPIQKQRVNNQNNLKTKNLGKN